MEIRRGTIDFSLPLRGSGPRTSSQTVVFPRAVLSATSGLAGYMVEYSPGDDHHVGRVEIKLDTNISSNTVTVNGTLGLRDWSGNWDDNYDGFIDFVVLAELESATASPPRTDLQIVDMEYNQTVQYFRADTYLDPAHVQPDNSIWLVARKATGIRVYVDWDSGAGLPAINTLTGELGVETGSQTLTLTPINPSGGITPRRDSEISLAVADHTLNFRIPGFACVGAVTVTCRVWDSANPASKSGAFVRTLTFTPVKALSVYLVGVNYNAVNPNLPGPTQAAVSSSLIQLIETYPMGDIIQTGYNTLTFGETVTGNVASGCGNGLNDLLDRLNDLRGSSSDIYLGSLPAGVVSTPGNSIGGCAPQGGSVAAVFVDLPADVPHEIGHALGRRHAPCTGGRCNPPPADPDGSYPQYGSFPSDSIGLFGFDAATNTVFNPASTFDFMAYSFPQWISEYTYNGLRGSSFGAVGGPSPGGSPHLKTGVNFNVLFLGLEISRERQVTRVPSFHYDAPLLGRKSSCGDAFTAEFLDRDRKVLTCWPLHCTCTKAGCNCWPKRIRDDVWMPEGSRWFLVWEGEKKIYEEEIPAAPKVTIESASEQKEGVLLKWKSDAEQPVWYLVHWHDHRQVVYRGVAPRQTETSLLIPRRLFANQSSLEVRVLATTGISTGVAETVIKLKSPSSANPTVTLMGLDSPVRQPVVVSYVIHANVLDTAGRQLSGDDLIWFATSGQEIGRGPNLDLRQLGPGRHMVRVVTRSSETGTAARSWVIEEKAGVYQVVQEVRDPKIKPTGSEHRHPHPKPPDPCE
jgi:hypothetical protein